MTYKDPKTGTTYPSREWMISNIGNLPEVQRAYPELYQTETPTPTPTPTPEPTPEPTPAPTPPPTGYTGVSIVDYLKSVGQASDYASRARLAQQYGITGYQGTAAQNTQLLNALRGGAPPSPAPPAPPPPPDGGLPPGGGGEIPPGGGGDEGRGGLTPEQIAEQQRQQAIEAAQALLDSLQGDSTVAITGETTPAPPEELDLESEQAKLMTQYQTEPLETELVDIDKQMADLSALYETAISQEKGRSAPGAIIRARQAKFSEEQRIELDRLTRQKIAIQEQLNVKYNMINTVMNLKQMDYQTARQNYEWEYDKAVQAQQLLSTEQDKQKKDAQAVLNTTINLFSSAQLLWTDLSDEQQLSINKMEMTAGIPTGTVQAFMMVKPQAKLISSVNGYDAQGNAITTLIYDEGNGNIKTSYVSTGGVRPSEVGDVEAQTVEKRLSESKGSDGYVDPGVYSSLKRQTKMGPDEFDKRYGNLLSPQERKNLGIKTTGVDTELDFQITKEAIMAQYGEQTLKDRAKERGYGKKVDEFLNEVMNKVEYWRGIGMTDADIAGQKMQQIFDSVRKK